MEKAAAIRKPDLYLRKNRFGYFLSKQKGYRVTDNIVFYNDKKVARIFKKHGFYKFLEEVGVEWTKIISKNFCRMDSIYVIVNNTLLLSNASINK